MVEAAPPLSYKMVYPSKSSLEMRFLESST